MVKEIPYFYIFGQFYTESATVQTEKMTANVVLVPLRIIKAESPQ